MQVNKLDLQTLFTKQIIYEIPPFQRRYVWEEEEQWEPLWEDVRNTADNCIANFAYNTAHFLGAVVLKQQFNPSSMLEKREVVDGQQRLTTMQLLLDAVQEVLEEYGAVAAAQQLSILVLNDASYHRDEPDSMFKVLPTTDDREAFMHAMNNNLESADYSGSRIGRAHDFFKDQISDWLDQHSDNQLEAINALQKVVARLLELVVIDLDPNEEEHVIYETLNARGTPLAPSDLVKNMMVSQARNEGILEESEIWGFGGNWWVRQIRQGRLYRPRVDAFLNYWLNVRTQDEVLEKNLFSTFRRYFYAQTSQDQAIKDIASDLKRVGYEYYAIEEITENLKPEFATFLKRWKEIGAGVLTPVLLWLFSSEAPKKQVVKGIQALESFIVRRMICRMTTMGQNRLFIDLLPRLEEADVTQAGDVIINYLAEQKSNTGLWPDDDQLRDTFINQKIYGLLAQKRIRIVLQGIEDELRTTKAESQSAPDNLTIEHVMPQGWAESKHWQIPNSVADETQAKIDRNRIIHTIGNLTLTNQGLNSSLSNSAWQDKQTELQAHSTLFLNKDLLDNPPEVWDEQAIRDRAIRLYEVAIKVWPHADGI